jgi:Ca-activated chloride channel homolog
MKPENNEYLITQYLLGDLDEAQAAEIKQLLEDSEESRALAQELEPTLDLLRDALADSTVRRVDPIMRPADFQAEPLFTIFDPDQLDDEPLPFVAKTPVQEEPKKKGLLLQLWQTSRAFGNVAALFLATLISGGIWMVYGPGPAGTKTDSMERFTQAPGAAKDLDRVAKNIRGEAASADQSYADYFAKASPAKPTRMAGPVVVDEAVDAIAIPTEIFDANGPREITKVRQAARVSSVVSAAPLAPETKPEPAMDSPEGLLLKHKGAASNALTLGLEKPSELKPELPEIEELLAFKALRAFAPASEEPRGKQVHPMPPAAPRSPIIVSGAITSETREEPELLARSADGALSDEFMDLPPLQAGLKKLEIQRAKTVVSPIDNTRLYDDLAAKENPAPAVASSRSRLQVARPVAEAEEMELAEQKPSKQSEESNHTSGVVPAAEASPDAYLDAVTANLFPAQGGKGLPTDKKGAQGGARVQAAPIHRMVVRGDTEQNREMVEKAAPKYRLEKEAQPLADDENTLRPELTQRHSVIETKDVARKNTPPQPPGVEVADYLAVRDELVKEEAFGNEKNNSRQKAQPVPAPVVAVPPTSFSIPKPRARLGMSPSQDERLRGKKELAAATVARPIEPNENKPVGAVANKPAASITIRDGLGADGPAPPAKAQKLARQWYDNDPKSISETPSLQNLTGRSGTLNLAANEDLASSNWSLSDPVSAGGLEADLISGTDGDGLADLSDAGFGDRHTRQKLNDLQGQEERYKIDMHVARLNEEAARYRAERMMLQAQRPVLDDASNEIILRALLVDDESLYTENGSIRGLADSPLAALPKSRDLERLEKEKAEAVKQWGRGGRLKPTGKELAELNQQVELQVALEEYNEKLNTLQAKERATLQLASAWEEKAAAVAGKEGALQQLGDLALEASDSDGELISVVLDDVPLKDVVRMFSRISGASVIATEEIPDDLRVSVDVEDTEWKKAMEQILEPTDFSLIEKHKGIYTVIKNGTLSSAPDMVEAFVLEKEHMLAETKSFVIDSVKAEELLAANAIVIEDSKEEVSEIRERVDAREPEEPSVYQAYSFNPYVDAVANPFSTFSIDVDSASFTQTRNYMHEGMLPPPDAVRTEEFVNFFNYHYHPPTHGMFAVSSEAAPSPFGSGYLLKVGIKGKVIGRDQQRPAKLTFVIDTSGSMDTADRLGLAKRSLKMLIGHLSDHDEVAIVQYDFKARIVLNHTSAAEKKPIAAAIDGLQISGSTNLEDGIRLGYATAAKAFDPNGVNRVLLISDGMANLGNENADAILNQVESYREQGIYSSVFGFGLGNYNDTMLETLANKGNGVYHFIDSLDEAKRVFVDNLSATLNVIASDVKIQVEFNPQRVKRYRQLGYENRQLKSEQFRDDTVDAGEIGSGQAATALYELDLAGSPSDSLGTVHVRYRNVETGEIEETSRDILAADLVRDYEQTDPRFQLAACTAEFAEILRGSPFAEGSDYTMVADKLRPVAQHLNLDQNIQELLRLVMSASSMPRASK